MAFLMANTSARRVRVAALLLTAVGLALAASSAQVKAETALPSPYSSQTSWMQRETPAAALARHIRVLATSPKDFLALDRGGQGRARAGRQPGGGRVLRPRR